VPLIQKKIIRACNLAGKPVITATQMLESMISHPRPTRAETSDVANAILDGTDAVMLSGETASGQFPVEAVRTMVKIALDLERADLIGREPLRETKGSSISEAVAEAACRAASTLKAKAAVVFTQSGSTARLIAKFRPQLPIIAFTPTPTPNDGSPSPGGCRHAPSVRLKGLTIRSPLSKKPSSAPGSNGGTWW